MLEIFCLIVVVLVFLQYQRISNVNISLDKINTRMDSFKSKIAAQGSVLKKVAKKEGIKAADLHNSYF